MAEGTIKRLTDKDFGFIDTGTDNDMFFHSSNLEGVSYEELQEGQRVSYGLIVAIGLKVTVGKRRLRNSALRSTTQDRC